MFVSLRLPSAWRDTLQFESSVPGANAYTFVRRNLMLHVGKSGMPFARAEDAGWLWLCGDLLQPHRRGLFGGLEALVSVRTTFRFDWRDDAAARRAGEMELVHVSVDGSDGEVYRAWSQEPRFFTTPRTHVRVEALEGRANLDRMVGLLTYLWASTRAQYERRG